MKMQPLAGVGVDDAKQRRIGEIQICLIDADLRGIGRIEPDQAVALDGAPAFGPQALIFPQARITSAPAASVRRAMTPSAWPRNRPPAAVNSSCAFGANLKPAAIRCWRVTSSKKCPRAKMSLMRAGNCRIAHPIELHLTQAFRADRTGAEIATVILARRLGLLDQAVDQLIDRPGRYSSCG